MAINIKFDLVGNPEPPTIILANRNGNKLGQLKVNTESIELSDKFNDASEFSFTLNKYICGELTHLWDKVVDFKLVYCKEWDMWFEIKVELDEATETVKTVFCTQLGQAELSQIMLYNIEINTEEDIERDDYKISILYDENDPEASILNRILEKAPHYNVGYVSPTIANIQRSFSFDGDSVYDALQEIAEEIGCLFVFPSNSDANGKIQRTISVYDLQQNCNDCGHRGEFTDKCPKCDSTNITNGYGEDTLIFVTSDELASEGIQLTTDIDSVKNCFKLEAGDDLMTATIRNCNPNGTDYIWYFSDNLKEDMSEELVEKLESYNEIYKQYYNGYIFDIDTEMLNDYNNLVDKYSAYNGDLQHIATPITGYSALMNAYYNTIDLSLYLESGLMPSVEMSATNAEEQVGLLTSSSLSPVAVADITVASLATVNSAVLAMAKTIVKSTYKVQIGTSEMSDNGNSRVWSGNFIITNYSDEEDTSTGDIVSVEVNDDLEAFIKQKIDKALNKEKTEDLSIAGLFDKEYDDFCAELKKYALNPLIGFYDACQSCIDILIEQGVGNNESWADSEDGNLYESLYVPYYNKLIAIESEIKVREEEINIISGTYDVEGILVEDGLRTYIEERKSKMQNALNFEEYLGVDLWVEFCSYRREDKYSNDNYISDGLDNAELFKKALEFIEVAENEIYKSAELQHSISTTLNNLLTIPKFKPLVQSFKTGNWIRVQVDGKIYKLRLLEYEIDFGDFDNISVEFSDVVKVKNGITDVESILSQASSMASSYDSVQRQASQGNEARGTIEQWISNGLNTALVQIQSNDSEDITITKNGLLGRSYNELTDTYSPEQFKLTHNIMAYTTDNWETVSSALGKHEYTRWQNNEWVADVDYGLTSKFVTAGYVTGSQIIGGEIVSSNYKAGESGTYFNLIDGDFEIAGGSIIYDTGDKALTLKNVTIEWDSATKPEVTDITGLSEYLDKIDETEGNAKDYTDSKISELDSYVAKYLGLDGNTIIGENYVISPIIEGGYLNITNTDNNSRVIIDPNNLTGNGHIFQVHNGNEITVGIDSEGNATFNNVSIADGTLKASRIEGAYNDEGVAQFYIDENGNISGASLTSSVGENFSIDDQGLITGANLSIDHEISTEVINCMTISNKAYPKTLTSSPTIYVNVDSGDDSNECVNGAVFQTLQGAINSIPKFMNGRTVYIELQTDVIENVSVQYLTSGQIYIYLGGNTVYGYIRGYSCNRLLIYGGTKNGSGLDATGIIHPSIGLNVGNYTTSVSFHYNCYGYIQNVEVYGADNLASGTNWKTAVGTQQGAFAYVIDTSIVNVDVGFRANAGGRIYASSSSGVASSYGFAATTGGYISINSGAQAGGSTSNTFENNGGTIKSHTPTFEAGESSSSDSTASTEKVAKNVTYTSSSGNAIQNYGGSSAKWRSDNTPKVGTWGYGNHVAFWFFDDDFANVSSKDVSKVEITFTRNSGGYASAVAHNFYAHSYETQPSIATPSYCSTLIGTASVATGNSATITITDSSLISEIISRKGICSIPPSQSKTYYSVMSGTMKVKFYYIE